MSVEPRCIATAIGSLPHSTAEAAIKVVLTNIPDAPIWPQLPALGMNEQMEPQYSEGIPRLVIDREKERMYFDTTGDYSGDLGSFYEDYLAENFDKFAISPAFSKGFYAMEAALEASLKETGKKRPFVKVQVTGPISFGLDIVDEKKRAIYYNEEFMDVLVKDLAMKCYSKFADTVICFIDEPILSAFGSSTYVSVQRADVVAKINEVVEAIHAEGAIAGVHCCGNTEWSILVDADVDIINFDAFDYADTIALYAGPIKKHLEAGKTLAWGVVPTNAAKLEGLTVDALVTKFNQGVDNLAKASGLSRDVIVRQAFVSPSCGTGSLPVPVAEKAFSLLHDLSTKLRA
jgi:methionine synthase II (cobalamin-independent)